MEFTIANYTFTKLPKDKMPLIADLLEMKFVDVGIGDSHDVHHLVADEVAVNPRQIGIDYADLLATKGVEISDVFIMVGDRCNDLDPAVRGRIWQRWMDGLTFAEAVGCKHLSVLPGLQTPGSDETDLALTAEMMNKLVEVAGKIGVTVGVEPHTTSEIDTPEKTLKLLEAVPGLTLTLDYSHFIRDGFSQDEVDVLIPYASHIHCRHAVKGRLQTRSDESGIDYGKFAEELKRCAYKGKICVEFCVDGWERQNEVDTLSEIWKLKCFLKDQFQK